MQIVLTDCREKLNALGIDPTKARGMERLCRALDNRVPGWLGWGYNPAQDILTIDLPDPAIPDTSALGRRIEREGVSRG